MRPAALALLRSLLGSHRGPLIRLLALSAASTLSAGAGVTLLLPLLRGVGLALERPGATPSPSPLTPLLEALSLEGALLLYVGISAFQALLSRHLAVEGTRLTEGFTRLHQGRLFRAVERARWDTLLGTRASHLLHAATVDLRRITGVVRALPNLGSTILVSAVHLGLAALLSPSLTVGSALLGLGLLRLVGRRSSLAFQTGARLGARWRDQTGDLEEYLDGFKIARCYGAGARHLERMLSAGQELASLHAAATWHQATSQLHFRLTSGAVLAGIVYFAVRSLDLPPARLLVVLYLFSRVVPQFSQIEQQLTRMAADLPAFLDFQRILERLEEGPEPLPLEGPGPLPWSRSIRFEEVHYRYPDGGGRGLHGVCLEIPFGSLTALTGPSGAGKTTAVDLLLGLLHPTRGTLTVDDAPLLPEQLGRWRQGIGCVTQETFLFHDTLRANLLWARPEATEAQLWHALELAQAGFVRDLPEGLDTVVGDRGARLSGGERQRIALARALLREPSLLILDEPTSSLDEEAEARILDVVEGLRGRVTVFLITHREACAARADRRYRLQGGRLQPAP